MAKREAENLLRKVGTSSRLYQKEIGNSSIPSYAPNHSHQIAQSPAWTGDISPRDEAIRTAADKGYRQAPKAGPLQPMKKEPKVSVSQRLAQARDRSLDYRIERHAERAEQTTRVRPADQTATAAKPGAGKAVDEMVGKSPSFKDLYAERFTLSGGTGTIASIESLASQRIDEAIAQGQFDNLPRGKQIQVASDTPWVDQTEFILNRMIQRQGAAPPWIVKQGQVDSQIATARKELLDRYIGHAVSAVSAKFPTASAEEKASQAVSASTSNWQAENHRYVTVLVDNLNSAIRGYNLIAPATARRAYLNTDAELARVYDQSKARFLAAFRDQVAKPVQSAPLLHRNRDLPQSPHQYYGVRHLIRDLWKKSTN